MKYWALFLFMAVSLPLFSQKKLVPAASSPLTGIPLPEGSKQDSRGLVVASARVLLEYESKKSNSSIGETEVLSLPSQKKSGYTADSLGKALNEKGWQIFPLENDNKYAWLQKDNIFLLAYFSTNANSTDLYFGKANPAPSINAAVTNDPATGNPAIEDSSLNNTPNTTSTANSILGTWYTSSMISNNITHSYIKKQYTFNPDGSYTFYKKTFDISWSFILLTKEKGTYSINGDILSINPASSVIEKWNKKDRADQWGNLLSSEKRKLEKADYQFSKQYFQGIDEWDLVLKTPKQTERDGAYATNSSFPNSYMYSVPPSGDYLIELPGETKIADNTSNPVISSPGGFAFTSTNWDNGWVSTIEEDKVVVKKNQAKVYIYFAVAYDDVSRSAGRDYFWDQVISKQFRVLSKQYQDGGEVVGAFHAPYVEGKAIDPQTGQPCFLGLYTSSGSGYMYPTLAVAPDEATLRNLFPKAADKYASDLAAMRNYNKFAISLNDISGNWMGGDFGAMNYYNVYSGNYAGMSAVAMSDEFHFSVNGTYTSSHKGASGMVGNMNTYQQEYKGKITASDWEIVLTNRWQGKTDTYYAYYEAVKGGRVLHLQDKKASSMWYHLVKKPA